MITVTPLENLGYFKNDWLEARHHFSFADYLDPDRMGLGALRVWNDDTIQSGGEFPPHPHREMEIITFLRHGARVASRASLGQTVGHGQPAEMG
ncbi:MAG TPA: hypothetical protein EYO85_05450, partial [Rhodospirillales bacterium]|nr:hypothetical protein [Rhodospirillales bacterium]